MGFIGEKHQVVPKVFEDPDETEAPAEQPVQAPVSAPAAVPA
jgi:hypothetical protein